MSEQGGRIRSTYGAQRFVRPPDSAASPDAAADRAIESVAAAGDVPSQDAGGGLFHSHISAAYVPSLPSEEPYDRSSDHLMDELTRLDCLVRAQIEIWQEVLAAYKTHEQLALPIITAGEIAAYLALPFAERPPLSESTEQKVAKFRNVSWKFDQAIARRVAMTPAITPLRLVRLAQLFELSSLEQDALVLSLLPEVDSRYRRIIGFLLDDGSRAQPTVALIQAILAVGSDPAGRALFDPEGTLVRRRLVILGEEVRDDDAVAMRSVRVDERIANYLLDGDSLFAPVGDMLANRSAADRQDRSVLLRAEESDRLESLIEWWDWRRNQELGAVLYLHGPYGSGRRTTARLLTNATTTPLLELDVRAALAQNAWTWSSLLDLGYREALLLGAAVCWTNCESLLGDDSKLAQWEALLSAAENYPGLTILIGTAAFDPSARFRQVPFLSIPFLPLDFAERRDLWRYLMPPDEAFASGELDGAPLAETLANGFQLTPGQMLDAIATASWIAVQRDPLDPELRRDDLSEGCRRQSGRHLIAFATRSEARSGLTFDDLILPAANRRQLDELRIRLARQGFVRALFEDRLTLGQGLIALFTGGSGTGKTMAAELLARDQGLDLYKIDLSAVVSKWVGETEKNLDRVFTEAADANAILFFDEADALFGQRAKVEQAQDRWANMEVNFLLQRVEEYAGIVILASNLRQNIDDAFVRRIQVIVDFPFPEVYARFEIIRGLIPAEVVAPDESVLMDLAERFKLSGGSWKNIVVDATFRAAVSPNHRPVLTDRHLILAVAREYQKLGKPLIRGEFGEAHFRIIEQEIM